jgi:hypothetical protein
VKNAQNTRRFVASSVLVELSDVRRRQDLMACFLDVPNQRAGGTRAARRESYRQQGRRAVRVSDMEGDQQDSCLLWMAREHEIRETMYV